MGGEEIHVAHAVTHKAATTQEDTYHTREGEKFHPLKELNCTGHSCRITIAELPHKLEHMTLSFSIAPDMTPAVTYRENNLKAS